ncbi:hypothetical protein PACTADRAFT_140530 [Pachysolen tannophilus NRRL Y-2460]|uniref:Uncharacterized protein n=1 Tax=Pachysolen tannophilus NRRL Y-2460 TaxID=669874 RepID=A0A1E4U0Z6_PACTA|nr:hypothetical protein PACTADRAFT_140530 [Pachysolen tannophilus NRRL Y-2460]
MEIQERKPTANSIKFAHTRTPSTSSNNNIDITNIQPPPARRSSVSNYGRSSIDSIRSNSSVNSSTSSLVVDDQKNNGIGNSNNNDSKSFMFRNKNNSSNNMLPLTKTVSFSSILTNDNASNNTGSSATGNANVRTAKSANRLSRLFNSNQFIRRKKSIDDVSGKRNKVYQNADDSSSDSLSSSIVLSPKIKPVGSSNESAVGYRTANHDSSGSLGGGAGGSLLERELSRAKSVKDKKRVKKPVDLSIQTSNLIPNSSNTGVKRIISPLGSKAPRGELGENSNDSTELSRQHKYHPLNHLHINHHNLLVKSRLQKDYNPLSSSSSNSKLVSDSGQTLYSFSTTNNNINGVSNTTGSGNKDGSTGNNNSGGIVTSTDLQRTLMQLENLNLNNLKYVEDKENIADDSWNLLTSLIMPLFKCDNLKVPIEDLNKLCYLYIFLRFQEFSDRNEALSSVNSISNGNTTPLSKTTVFDEVQELFKNGFSIYLNNVYAVETRGSSTSLKSLYSSLSLSQLLKRKPFQSKLSLLWDYFLTHILYYLEAIFLPLQQEIDGVGPILSPYSKHKKFWFDYLKIDNLKTVSKIYEIKLLALLNFRDKVVIPLYETEYFNNLTEQFIIEEEDEGDNTEVKIEDEKHIEEYLPIKLKLIQCLSTLKRIDSSDTKQYIIEKLLRETINS